MTTHRQSIDDINEWHEQPDPWGYESNPEDEHRKAMLLGAIPRRVYTNVLDIGCGQGFITRDLPGARVTGVDVSVEAIAHARRLTDERLHFHAADIFELTEALAGEHFDLVVITGVLYRQYIGRSHTLIYHLVDQLMMPDGILISVHINEWYTARFPYTMLAQYAYPYRQYFHRLEVYGR